MGPEGDIFKDSTTGYWEHTVVQNVRDIVGDELIKDEYLRIFVHAMRYLWVFFPPKGGNTQNPPCVPFSVTITEDKQ